MAIEKILYNFQRIWAKNFLKNFPFGKIFHVPNFYKFIFLGFPMHFPVYISIFCDFKK